MKTVIIILLIVLAVILFALFGPSQPQPPARPSQAASPTPATTPMQQRPATATTAAPQAQTSPRERGELSTPALATGVTTETVDVGGGGATFEAKRRMTDKLRQVSPSGSKKH